MQKKTDAKKENLEIVADGKPHRSFCNRKKCALKGTGKKLLVEQKEKSAPVEAARNLPSKREISSHPEDWWMNIENETPSFPEGRYVSAETDIFTFDLLPAHVHEYVRIRETLREMKELMYGEFAVVIFPSSSEVDDDLYERIMTNEDDILHDEIKKADRHAVYNNIKAILEEEDIPLVDLLEPLQEGHKKYGRVYHYRDHHLNYWGNHVASREIRKFLADYFAAEKDIEDDAL